MAPLVLLQLEKLESPGLVDVGPTLQPGDCRGGHVTE